MNFEIIIDGIKVDGEDGGFEVYQTGGGNCTAYLNTPNRRTVEFPIPTRDEAKSSFNFLTYRVNRIGVVLNTRGVYELCMKWYDDLHKIYENLHKVKVTMELGDEKWEVSVHYHNSYYLVTELLAPGYSTPRKYEDDDGDSEKSYADYCTNDIWNANPQLLNDLTTVEQLLDTAIHQFKVI